MNEIVVNNTQPQATVSFDLLNFIISMTELILSDVEFAYPHNELDEERAHPMLQKIQGEARALKTVVENIKKS